MTNESDPQFKLFDPRSSLEEIAAQVSEFGKYAGATKTPLADIEAVEELDGVTARYVAAAGTYLMTGLHTKTERQELQRAMEVRRRMIGVLALDATYRKFDQTGSVDKAKRTARHRIAESDVEAEMEYFEQRLEASPVERTKEWVAQHALGRVALSLAASVSGSGLIYKGLEASPWLADLPKWQERGAFGVVAVLGGLAIGALHRNAPAQVGMVFRNRVLTSGKAYELKKADRERYKGAPLTRDEKLEIYAEHQLERSTSKMALDILDYDVESRDDFPAMINHALGVAEESILEGYGIDSEEGATRGPWYRRVVDRLALAN